jgi:hypothetical protein
MEKGKIDISGIDKADLLAALHNGTRPLGMGRLHAIPELTADKAREALADYKPGERLYFDYVFGRPVKCDITGDMMETWLYDRDAGEGAAARVIAKLREVTKAA